MGTSTPPPSGEPGTGMIVVFPGAKVIVVGVVVVVLVVSDILLIVYYGGGAGCGKGVKLQLMWVCVGGWVCSVCVVFVKVYFMKGINSKLLKMTSRKKNHVTEMVKLS